MRNLHRNVLAALTLPVSLWLAGSPASAIGMTVAPAEGHPKLDVNVKGAGFGANEAVDIYFDTTDLQLTAAGASGKFKSSGLEVPSSAQPGTHWFTAIGRRTGNASQAKFTVQTNWVEFGWNEQGKRTNPYENVVGSSNVARLETAWSVFLFAPQVSPAAAANGLVYVGSIFAVSAIDRRTGKVKWSGCGLTTSSPAVANNIVYAASFDGHIYACNAATGAPIWSFQAGQSNEISSPVVVNGIVYFGTDEGKLYALNAATGAVICTTPPLGGALSTPAVVGGIAYFGSSDGNVWAVDAQACAQVWNRLTSGPVVSSPAVLDGRVYIGSNDGKVYALGTEFGDVRWTAATGGAVESSPAVANNSVYAGSDDGNLYALDKSTGARVWRTSIGGQVRSSPAVANGVVYIASNDNSIHALSASSGKALWSAVGGSVSPTITDGMLFVASFDSNAYGYALDAGNNAVYRRSTLPPPYASLHPDRHLKPVR